MKFKSKVDWWFHIIAAMTSVAVLLICIYGITQKSLLTTMIGIIILIADCLLIVPIWFNTYYTFEQDCLFIRCGLATKLKIPYKNITGIADVKSAVASAAPALAQMELKYINNDALDVIYLSPKGKDAFISLLKEKTQRTGKH